jgi:AcrR family transcriptional regulator
MSKARISVLALERTGEPVKPRRQRVDSRRRSPKRARGLDTIETIFEATARILQAEGRDGLNTNRIAEKAGFSIGAVYGYFPNKEAIVLAMARRELDLMRDRVIAVLLADDGSDEKDPIRRAIRAVIKGYGARGKVRRILMETLFAYGGAEEMARPVYEIGEVLVAHSASIFPGGKPPSPIGLFVISRALDNIIRVATYEGVAFLNTPAFEDELVRLVRGYFSAS